MSKDTSDLSSPTGSASPDVPTPPVSDVPRAAGGADLEPAGVLLLTDDRAPRASDVALAPLGVGLPGRLGAEAIGTFFLVLAGLGVALYTTLSGAGALGVSLGFGLALIGGTIAFGQVSGGHFNPAVTLGAAIAGRLPWRDLLPYWVAQLVGGCLAAAALYLTIPSALPTLVASGKATSTRAFFATTASGFGQQSPLSRLSTGQVAFDLLPALLVEIISTALFVGVFLASTRRRTQRNLAPFAIGFTYAVLVLVASPISNGALNPARATAAAIFSNGAFGQLWVFWLAPLVGALLAGLAYRAFAAEPIEEVTEEDFLEEEELELDHLPS